MLGSKLPPATMGSSAAAASLYSPVRASSTGFFESVCQSAPQLSSRKGSRIRENRFLFISSASPAVEFPDFLKQAGPKVLLVVCHIARQAQSLCSGGAPQSSVQFLFSDL